MIRGTPQAHERARKLRAEMTKPERLLWWALRANKTGWHFRRQHAAVPYILDFYCHEARVCVEVDGEQHAFRSADDLHRDAFLSKLGIQTIRYAAHQVETNLSGVVADLIQRLGNPSVSASPSHLP